MIAYIKHNYQYLAAAMILLAVIFHEATGKGDFYIFLSASRDLWEGKNIYTTSYNDHYHYFYSVFFAVLITPLTALPLYFAKVLWLISNVYFVYRIWKILTAWLPVEKLNKKAMLLFTCLSYIFIFRFLRDNFHLSQVTILILYLALEGIWLISNDKKIAGSFLIALGIDIKVLPIVLILYLFYRKEWKALILVLSFIIFLIAIPLVFLGYNQTLFLTHQRWLLINPINTIHVMDISERSFHSLTTLLSTLLVADNRGEFDLDLKRNIANLSIKQLSVAITLCRAALIIGAIWFFKTRPFKKNANALQRLYELSYLFLIVPLIFPHQQHYAFFFAFPASTYLIFYLVFSYYNTAQVKLPKQYKLQKLLLSSLLVLVFLLTSSHFILGQFSYYYDHFKILTYGMLLLVLLLACYSPKKLQVA